MRALPGVGDFMEGGRGENVEGGRWAGSSWVGVASSLVCSTSSSNRDIPKISPLAIDLKGALENEKATEPQPGFEPELSEFWLLISLNYWSYLALE